MRLAEAVTSYVEARRNNGSPLHTTEVTLRAFCRHCGNIDLDKVTADLVSSSSNDPRCVSVTRISKFSGVRCFLEYCSVRGLIRPLSLQRPAKPKNLLAPYIYTQGEIVALLRATDRCQSKARELSAETFRRLILLLYGTGATIQEVLSLEWSSVDLKKRLITIDKSILRASRILPIGTGLRGCLARWRAQEQLGTRSSFVLCCADGRAVDSINLKGRFVRLRELAGVQARADGRVPRLQDLRFTFAVHRLNQWIRCGNDLNRLIPALSTYMGYRSLTTAEQFLAYVPSRFKQDLQKLSPSKGRKRWCRDAKLMTFLSSL